MPCRATQDTWVIVENATKCDPLEKGMASCYSCRENTMNNMKRQKDMTLKDELLRWGGAQYAGDQQRNNSRKNEEMKKKQKQHPTVGVTDDGSKV